MLTTVKVTPLHKQKEDPSGGLLFYLLTQFQTRKQPRPSGPAAVAAPVLWAGLHGACNRKTGNLNLTESTNTVDWEGLNENAETIDAVLSSTKAAAGNTKEIADSLAPRVTAIGSSITFVKLGNVQVDGTGTHTFDLSDISTSQFFNLIFNCT